MWIVMFHIYVEMWRVYLTYDPLSAAMEIGPQPHGVVRSNIYTAMKAGVQHMLDWVHGFNSGTAD